MAIRRGLLDMKSALVALALALPQPAFAATADRTATLETGLRALQAADQRIATIAFRLATANNDLCLAHTPLTGLVLNDLQQYGAEFRPVVQRLFNMGEAPTVQGVVTGGPGEQAGLRVGDRLLTVNGASLLPASPPDGDRPSSNPDYGAMGEAMATLDAALASGPVMLGIEREGVRQTVTLTPVQGCPSAIQLMPSRKRDASADGRIISLTTALLDFTQDDDELAAIIGHEMAHNGLQHRLALDARDVKRGLLGQFGKNATRIRQTECEADYVGIYYMARAGFDIGGVPAFYRRLGGTYDLGPFSDRTHPSGRKREEAAQAALDEIAAKRAEGLPLTPDPRCGDHLD